MLAHAFSSSTPEAEAGSMISEFKASLVCKANSRTARVLSGNSQRKSVSGKRRKKRKKRKRRKARRRRKRRRRRRKKKILEDIKWDTGCSWETRQWITTQPCEVILGRPMVWGKRQPELSQSINYSHQGLVFLTNRFLLLELVHGCHKLQANTGISSEAFLPESHRERLRAKDLKLLTLPREETLGHRLVS